MIPLLCIYTSYWAICSSVQHAFRGFWTFSMSTWCAALNRCLCWTLSWNPTCTTYVLYTPLAVPYTHAGGVHPFNYSPWHNLILGLHERGRLNNEWTNSSIFPLPSVVSNAKDINRLEHPEFPSVRRSRRFGVFWILLGLTLLSISSSQTLYVDRCLRSFGGTGGITLRRRGSTETSFNNVLV